MRGVASLLVFSYHARNLLFVDAGESPGGLGLLAKAFYFVTGFGHLSVLIFFVLSGCVIANVLFSALERGDWSWRDYLLARVTRLWVVILPGLILTCGCDLLAWRLFPDSLPHTVPAYAGMLSISDRQHLGTGIFFANAFFLQTIVQPTYGSNGALWSLANEFWYYIFFPLLLVGSGSSRRFWPARIAGIVIAGIGLTAAGAEIARLFPVWLMGALAYFCWFRGFRCTETIGRRAVWVTVVLMVVVCSAIRASAAHGGHPYDDFVVGLSVALFLFFLLDVKPRHIGQGDRVLSAVSRMSFTLYIVHTPILVLIACFFMRGRTNRWAFDLVHLAYLIAIMAVVLVVAWLVYRVTEAQTSKVRSFFENRLGGVARITRSSKEIP